MLGGQDLQSQGGWQVVRPPFRGQRVRPEDLRIGPRSNPTSEDPRFDGSVEEIGLRDPAAERKDNVDRAQPRRRGSAQDLEWRTYPSMPSTQK